jgi:hypothetical protein
MEDFRPQPDADGAPGATYEAGDRRAGTPVPMSLAEGPLAPGRCGSGSTTLTAMSRTSIASRHAGEALAAGPGPGAQPEAQRVLDALRQLTARSAAPGRTAGAPSRRRPPPDRAGFGDLVGQLAQVLGTHDLGDVPVDETARGWALHRSLHRQRHRLTWLADQLTGRAGGCRPDEVRRLLILLHAAATVYLLHAPRCRHHPIPAVADSP